MDDIAQDPSSNNPAERAARGRAIWDRYSAEHPFATLEDVITDLLHLADEDIPGADAVLYRLDYNAQRASESSAARERALEGLPAAWQREARRVID
ncbi:hypothetical protein [Streptomyces botrytidirepellens]|uniref:Uncharacterized protein n=1 Tax=Streptomyces botrytidirepellens TaxID=2486417 RepID=A0A3M8UKQ0_9ACTN|nr:hypothetical protein [Streptomyces botrytidirepellens]RNG04745.1 hypothetical protein EEJ42_33920 [Streptomyces botrytidirepellens]